MAILQAAVQRVSESKESKSLSSSQWQWRVVAVAARGCVAAARGCVAAARACVAVARACWLWRSAVAVVVGTVAVVGRVRQSCVAVMYAVVHARAEYARTVPYFFCRFSIRTFTYRYTRTRSGTTARWKS